MKLGIIVVAFIGLATIVASEDAPVTENILVEVKNVEKGINGENLESVLKVNLHIVALDGIVHVNGRRIDHSLVNAVHTKVELDQYSMSGELIRHSKARIQVRILVKEGGDATNGKTLTVEEEIVEVNKQVVTQVDIKEVVMHLNGGNKEIKRVVTTIKVSESRIHKMPRENDFHCYQRRHHGRLPHPPFHATRGDMKHMGVPVSYLRPAKFPDHPMRGHEWADQDEDAWEGHGHDHRHHHHRHHRFGKKFCRWFHRLPTGVRVVAIIGVVFVGLAGLTCCISCCRKRKANRGVPMKVPVKEDLYYDEEIDEAEPLPTKTSLDKVQLVVS